jgi:hypothetical protein
MLQKIGKIKGFSQKTIKNGKLLAKSSKMTSTF